MKRPTFFHGVVVAAVLAFFASAVVATLTPFVGLGSVVRLVIPGLGLAYVLYLFSRSTERLGRVTALSAWSVMAAITWWMAPFGQHFPGDVVFLPGARIVRRDPTSDKQEEERRDRTAIHQ
jgi:hypothetical protein